MYLNDLNPENLSETEDTLQVTTVGFIRRSEWTQVDRGLLKRVLFFKLGDISYIKELFLLDLTESIIVSEPSHLLMTASTLFVTNRPDFMLRNQQKCGEDIINKFPLIFICPH